ncbi:hypothetical protein RUM43_014147 [Polyplax serrata]|uniref:GH18 domain-containing protein n=1 Tax=Polyplax serrata TaxID=468196 RepID=A0AAN8NJE6_POLSC
MTINAAQQFDVRCGGNQHLRTEHSFTGLAENCTSDDSDCHLKTKLVCFYIFTKEFQPGIMRDLCTHIIVGFFGINEETYCLDNSTEKLQELNEVAALKQVQKDLKVLLSVGGAGFNGFNLMVAKHVRRKKFIKSIIETLKIHNIDGIDLDWEWPVINGNDKEKIKFVQLLYEFRQEFNKCNNHFIISVDVSSLRLITELAYNIQYLAKLMSCERHSLNAPAIGFGSIGSEGFATYAEICKFIEEQNASVVFDSDSKVPYAYKFTNWISYDNEMSLAFKFDEVEPRHNGQGNNYQCQ